MHADHPKALRVVVIEDETLIAQDLELQLQDMGYEVVGRGRTGEEALNVAAEMKPDVMMLDIHISGQMDGIAVATKLPAIADTAVIFLSAHSETSTVERAKKTGAAGFLVKPVDSRELRAMVEVASYKQSLDRELRNREEQLRLLAENMSDFVAMYDVQGKCLYASPSCYRLAGYTQEEMLEMDQFRVIHPDDKNTSVQAFEAVASGRGTDASSIYRLQRKDGTYTWVETRAESILGPDGLPAKVVAVTRDVSQRIAVEKELRDSREQLRHLFAHMESAREEDRRKIAREVHDELGQALTAMKIDLTWLSKAFADKKGKMKADAGNRISQMGHLIDMTIESVRRISREIRPVILDDLGIISALEWYLQQFQAHTEITAAFNTELKALTLDRERSVAVFRIVQELLTNVARHARASRVTVSLAADDGVIECIVADNGCGISTGAQDRPSSLGLLGIRERLQIFGGAVKFDGAPGDGTTVSFTLPYTSE
jgi:two-component system sensor histidine kinase UhpB